MNHKDRPDLRIEDEYPTTDQEMLLHSVEEFLLLMKQGEILLNRLADRSFSKEIMEEAQKGNQKEVDALIQTIEGLFVPTTIQYTPSGIIFNLASPAISKGEDCCILNMTLKWGK